MFKRVVLAAVFLLVAVAVFNTKTLQVSAKDKDEEKVRICHRTNSVVNPYVSIEVDVSAVDGAGANDHTHHTGPVFNPAVHTQQNRGWGDIIPNLNGATPLNWDDGKGGNEIWNNNCQIPTPDDDEPNIVFEVVCAENQGKPAVKVSFANFGGASGSVNLNGQDIDVASGATEVRYVDVDTLVTIKIGDQEVYNQTPDCVEDEDDDDDNGQVLGDDDVTPIGGVNAGSGAVTNQTAAVAGIIVSLSAVGAGAILRKKLT